MTAISYHRTVKDLQGLAWESAGPFARAGWFSLLERAVTRPMIAVAQAGGTALALPLAGDGGRLEALTNWYAFTWQPLFAGGDAAFALLPVLARDLARRAHRVELVKLAAEDGTLDRLRRAFAETGWLVMAEPCDTNHVLPIRHRSYAEYLADRPGQLRTTLKRKAKQVEVRIATQFDAPDWAAYEAIYAASWKPEEGDPALLRAFAEGESAAGRYRFGIARHQGEAVAAQFWTVDQGTAYIHKLAHREDARGYSPGTTLTAALLAQVIDTDRVELVDFGTGDDAYKRDWMEAVRVRWRLVCLRPGDPRNWPEIGKLLARRLVSRGSRG